MQSNNDRPRKVVDFRRLDEIDNGFFNDLQAQADRVVERRMRIKQGKRVFTTLAIALGAGATILGFGWWQWANMPAPKQASQEEKSIASAKLEWLSQRRNWLQQVFTFDFKEPTSAEFKPGYLQQLIANIGTERLAEARERQKDDDSACSTVELTACLMVLELQDVDQAILLPAQTGTQFTLVRYGEGRAKERSAALAATVNEVIVANKGKLNQKAIVAALTKEVETWDELKVVPVTDLSQSETTFLAIGMKLGFDSTTLGWQPVFPTDPYRFNAMQRQTQGALSNVYALQDRTDAAAAIANIQEVIGKFEKQRSSKK